MATSDPLKRFMRGFVAFFLLSTGATFLLYPTVMAAGFGMPIESNSIAAGFVQCVGGRNLTLGLIMSVFLKRGDIRAASTMATFLAFDGIVDGCVTLRYADAGWVAAAPHFGAAAMIPFISSWMSS